MAASPPRVTVRVAVQSPRRLLRDTLSACLALRPDVSVVGKVAEAGEIPALCELRRPDVVILDVGTRLGEIALLVRRLTRRFPELNVVVTYRDATEQSLAAACRAGVASLIPESHGLAAVLAVLRRRRGRDAASGLGGLTDRELEIVVLAGSGHSVREIAAVLGISPLTVENLKRRLYAKLDANSSAHAVSRAASFGMLDRRTVPGRRGQAPPSGDFAMLTVVAGRASPARSQVALAVMAGGLPFVLIRGGHGPASGTDWARCHRGPVIAALVDPEPADWDLAEELGVPAILVHSGPLDPPDLAAALASGASALVPADRIAGHFLSVLRMVGQGYLVVDSMPMRPLIGAMRARWDQRARDGGLPELTARETDILASVAQGYSIRQTARVLGIAPKTVENVQTRLFSKLGVRNRSGAVAVADAFGLLPAVASAPDGSQEGFTAPDGYSARAPRRRR